MINLLISYWYRKQTIFEDLKIFKYMVYLFVIIMVIICTTIIKILTSTYTPFERLILMLFVSMVFTLYNLPTFLIDIKSKRFIAILQMDKYHMFFTFCYVKRNIIIIPYLIGVIINLLYNAYFDPINFFILIDTLIIQCILILLDLTSNKLKLIYIFCISLILFTYKLNILLFIICGSILSLVSIFYKISYILRGRYIKQKFYSIYIKNINLNYFNYIIKYLIRIQKKEYIDIIFTSIIAIVIYKFTNNTKIISMYFVLFFFAKIQLQIEAKQVNFHEIFAKNAFFDVRHTSVIKKILYSNEFKLYIMDLISIIIFVVIISMFFDSFKITLVFDIISLIVVMFMYLNKILKIFYLKLHEKKYFKGTCINLILFYLVFFLINTDLIITKPFSYLITFIISGIFIILPIERLLSKNLLGGDNDGNTNI